jgi:hypothetical protein
MPRVYTRTDPATRFWAKVYKYRGCWLWEGSKVRGRYGQFAPRKGQNVRPARYAWEATYGPLGAGMDLLRRCSSPACVRPLPSGSFFLPLGHACARWLTIRHV